MPIDAASSEGTPAPGADAQDPRAGARQTLADLRVDAWIAGWSRSALAPWIGLAPWVITQRLPEIVTAVIGTLSPDDWRIDGDIAVHRSAGVESGAILKGPLVIGPQAFVAAGAYLRGGCWLDARCILGPGAELKTSVMFAGSKLAHFNFVGDSLLGGDVNLEAGSIVCNYRNERADTTIRVRAGGVLHAVAADKFGALIGDGARVGANAVLAPGALLAPGGIVRRLSLLDQEAG